MLHRAQLLGAAALAALTIFACSDDDEHQPAPTPAAACEAITTDFRFPLGSPDGHADPFGAKAAGQARAGRVRDPAQIVQHPDSRARVRVDDFVLANDRIAVYVEAEGRQNGYTTLGGDILVIDAVGDDGRPKGLGLYGDTAITLARQSVKPDKVTVLADGEDGKAAIVRVSGVLANIPFFDSFRALASEEYGFPAAFDYVLEPGAEKVTVRLSVANPTADAVDFGKKQFFGLFQGNLGQAFTDALGFTPPKGEHPWLAFANGGYGFVLHPLLAPLKADLELQGFQLFTTSGLKLEGCENKTVDYVELVGGGPGIDGLLEAKRRALGEPAWRELRGVVREQGGGPLPGAWVHATSAEGKYLTRAQSGADGAYVLHVPSAAVQLTPTLQGWAIPAATAVAADAATADVMLPPRATIDVTARDATTNELLPVRVQVLPASPLAPAPESFGIREEKNGLWQEFAVTGRATLPVPPGNHRVIVSRGFEYELHDAPAVAESGKTTTIAASLQHSVDTPGVMCADFHVHSSYSLDSNDPFEEKVKSAITDGLEIPVSSEHQYIEDFLPVIQRLGLTKWAYSFPSAELTTFTWGHFGVIPAHLDRNAPNNGATPWMGRLPAEVFKEVNEAPEKPVLVVNHPRAGLFQGYFGMAGFDRALARGTNAELWSEAFAALEVVNGVDFDTSRDAAVADWFSLLGADKTYWAVGNSDSHDYRREFVGYPRNCLRFGHDDPSKLTAESVRDVLRAGANVVTGGLYLTVEGPGGIGPGGKAAAGAYKVTVASAGWVTPTSVEVIVDGVTTQTVPVGTSAGPGPGKRFDLVIDVQPTQSRARHWVLFHATGTGDLAPVHPGKKPFAFSNPIFF